MGSQEWKFSPEREELLAQAYKHPDWEARVMRLQRQFAEEDRAAGNPQGKQRAPPGQEPAGTG
ncbi:MAG TPA: hypothetical protein VEH31_26790 [Streptosporangiaceae bacterium]|nr:hypothetical protein [Streptosporangiaceae bacterium]